MSNLMARCCGCTNEPENCCQWWECATTPTTISVHILNEVVRYYSNGQRLVQEKTEITISSASAITQKGEDCNDVLGYDAGCITAQVDYDHSIYYYTWSVNTDSTIDGTTPTHPHPDCSGCIFTGSGNAPVCRSKLSACLYRTDSETWSGTRTGATASPSPCPFARGDSDILKYGCTTDCGCVRPFIQYRPLTPTVTGNYTITYGCCTDDTDVEGDPILITIPGFTLVGSCGCPSGSSWINPINPCDCPGPYIFDFCINTCGCTAVNHDVLIATGTDAFSWYCENYHPDPVNPIVTACEASLDWEEYCETTVTVTVT